MFTTLAWFLSFLNPFAWIQWHKQHREQQAWAHYHALHAEGERIIRTKGPASEEIRAYVDQIRRAGHVRAATDLETLCRDKLKANEIKPDSGHDLCALPERRASKSILNNRATE